jgi:hypothetical protein
LLKPLLAHTGVATIACGVGLLVARLGDWDAGFSITNALVLGLVSLAAGLAYLVFAYYFKLEEARKFVNAIRARLF